MIETLMQYVPALPALGAFAAAALVLTLTPGPDMTLFLGKAVAVGRMAGFAAFFGALTGLFVHLIFAAVGISALLAASPQAFLVLKIAGAAYLLWLAVQALRKGSGLTLDPADKRPEPMGAIFLSGLGINLLNPKIILFFVTFLPQFVSPADPHASGKIAFLGLFFIVLAIPICMSMIVAADRIADRLKKSPWMVRAVDWTFAGVMGAFAVRLLAARAG